MHEYRMIIKYYNEIFMNGLIIIINGYNKKNYMVIYILYIRIFDFMQCWNLVKIDEQKWSQKQGLLSMFFISPIWTLYVYIFPSHFFLLLPFFHFSLFFYLIVSLPWLLTIYNCWQRVFFFFHGYIPLYI